MSRKRISRIPKTTIFIACEGTNTEPIYFERIKEEVEEYNFLSIEVYPSQEEEKPKTDALGLIREAKSRLIYFDEVWAVFDKNGYTKHQEAFDEADEQINGKKVRIVFSSISFEHWILLHFEKNDLAFLKSANIIDNKFANNEMYYPDYNKRSDIDIYPRIKEYTETAIENAAWLRFKQNNLLATYPIHEINPYTDVDVLVKRLLNISKDINWAKLGDRIKLKNAHVTIDLDGINLQAIIANTGKSGFISTQCAFYSVDIAGKLVLQNIEKINVEPKNESIFFLCERTKDLSLIKIEFENTICYVEI